MLIASVDFPDPVLDALRESRLVIFAGAGVSVPPPSSYPDFGQLADRIGAGVYPRRVGEAIDRFLGRLCDRGVAVHAQVREVLSSPDSHPNELHHSLVSLFREPSDLRIVTTNFDRHFTTAAREHFKRADFDVSYAPALPLGDDFAGLVYLHGSVERLPKTLVLTDRDFGRAYITEGWAFRFVQRLFIKYIVLFVGYSHRDVVMNYLVRGLVSAAGPPTRFVLTLPGDDEHWENLGIVPVHFPESRSPESKYAQLGHAVASWVEISRLGALDIEQRIKEIVEGPVPLDAERLDYIRRALGELTTLRFFVRHAAGLNWMQWIDRESSEFARLFQTEPMATESDLTLAYWFAEKFALRHPAEALTLLRSRGFSMRPVLWTAILHEMHRWRPAGAVLGMWMPVLVQNRPPSGAPDLLEYILGHCRFPEDQDVAFLLFSALTAPEISLESRYGASADALPFRLEVATFGSEFWLNHVWMTFFKPNLAAFAHQLLGIVTAHLAHARTLLTCYASGSVWDSLNFGRGMIESRTQDHLNSGMSVVLDAGAELVRWSASEMPSLTVSMSEAWIGQDSPLLRRLAIFAVSVNKTWTADAKISWLLEHQILYARELKHEVFLLLEAAYPGAGPDARQKVVEKIVRTAHATAAVGDYEQFNLLTWLAEKNPACKFAARELAKIRTQHPDYCRRERPDLDFWIEEATWGDSEPQQDHLDLKEWPLNKIVEALEQRKSSMYPASSQVQTSLRKALAESFQWGVELAAQACAADVQSGELWNAVLAEWEALSAEDERWAEMLKVLLNCRSAQTGHFPQISSILNRKIRDSGSIPLLLLPDAINLVNHLWAISVASEHGSTVDSGDWLTVAINSTGGNLVSFYLHSLSQLSALDPHDKRIPDAYKNFFLAVIEGQSFTAAMARVPLAAQLTFLASLDEGWAIGNVLPLLDRSIDARRARQCWHGYVMWGRWTHALIPHLLPLFEQQFGDIAEESSEYRRVFCQRMADIAIFSEINPIENGWLFRFVQTVAAEDRLSWVQAVEDRLKGLDDQAKFATWTRWLRTYWQRRNAGIPLQFDATEAAEMVKLTFALEPTFEEATELLCSGPAPNFRRSMIYYSLHETGLATRKPEPTTRLILFLLRSEGDRPIYDMNKLEDVVRQLITSKAQIHQLIAIIDELARLGCSGAAQLRKELDYPQD
jgi:hypothetical protein